MRTERGHARRGFTAIEMVIVLSIMLLLTSIAAPNVYDALRRSKVNLAVAGIEDVAAQAQRLAAEGLAPASGAHYGIRISQDGPGAIAELVTGTTPGDATPLLDGDGAPIASYRFAPNVAVMVDGQQLASAGTPLVWFYRFQSGAPVAQASHTTPTTVGLPRISVSRQWGINDAWASPTIPAVAAATGSEPGLGVQSIDGAVRFAMAVYPTGLLVTRELR